MAAPPIVATGTLHRPADDWCPKCNKPSLECGPVSELLKTGVRPWGWFQGCFGCQTFTWRNIKGQVVAVNMTLKEE